ncbi:MAG: hypothetical protein WBS22_11610, partial [Methylocystis sp.]
AQAAAAAADAVAAADSDAAVRALGTAASVDDLWAAVLADAHFLVSGGSAAALADLPLWPQGTPAGSGAWADFSRALPTGQDWDVWTRWYEERLTGAASRGETYELVFATVPESVWERGPAAANQWIKHHLPPEIPQLPAEAEFPEQRSAAAQFTEAGLGPIDLKPDPASSEPSLRDEQREHYDEARRKALDLQALGGNYLSDELRVALEDLFLRFPEKLEEVNSIDGLWHRANRLRKILQAHKAAEERFREAVKRGGRQPDPDPATLDTTAAGKLEDFVESYNVFIVGDSKGRELDRKRLGPGERERDEKALAEVAPAIEDLQKEPQVATIAASEELVELTQTAQSAPQGLAGDQDVALARDSIGNAFVALWRKARRAWSELDEVSKIALGGLIAGAAKHEGEKLAVAIENFVGGPILHYVVRWAEEMKQFAMALYNNPSVQQLLDAIVRHLTHGAP